MPAAKTAEKRPADAPEEQAPSTPEATAEAATTATNDGFDFDSFDTQVPIPENIPTAPRANQLPFKDLFTKMEQAALDGKKPHKFIPAAYWTEERKVAADKVTSGYQRSKLNEQFNLWSGKKKGAAVEASVAKRRDGLKLILITRTGQEEDYKDRPGISLWMVKASEG